MRQRIRFTLRFLMRQFRPPGRIPLSLDNVLLFLPGDSVIQRWIGTFYHGTQRVRFLRFPQCMRTFHLGDFTMPCFDPEIALHLVDEGSAAYCDRLRPAVVSLPRPASERLPHPVT